MSIVADLRIAPSLLAADFGRFADAARDCERAGAEFLHFDVMDGMFVPNISFGMGAIRALRPISQAHFDIHLMIVQPERYVEEFISAGANSVTVQAEACVHLQRTLAQIRKAGAKAGVALNPATPESVLEYVMDDVDLVLVMTVNPGFGGQAFLPATLPKVRRVREMIGRTRHPIDLEVDGGIGADTASQVVKAGANVLVAGTSLFGNPAGVDEGIRALRTAAGLSEG